MTDVRFRCPFSLLIAGVSGSGKTVLTKKILEQAKLLYDKSPGPIYYFYKIWSPAFQELKDLGIVEEFIQGNCSLEWLEENIQSNTNSTVVLDDLVGELTQNSAEIFTVGRNNVKCNIIFMSQVVFSKNRYLREISLNSTYLLIMRNLRDSLSIRILSRQINPDDPDFLIWAYRKATELPYTHLLLDFFPESPSYIRYRSNILMEGDKPVSCYISTQDGRSKAHL